MEAVAPERRLAGRYVVEARIATGGMASVWRARDEVLARTVAVKVLRDDLARDPGFRERFHREAVAAARLNHPSIIRVFDTGVDGDVVYIVMEHVQGDSLAGLLEQSGPFEPDEAVDVMVPTLDALAYAHSAGIIHRDVKPANIMLTPEGRVKVMDFGIAKAAVRSSDLTTTGQVLGTVRYLSPEQVQGGELDGRSDVYAAGVVMYELVTGRVPFDAETDVATAMLRLTKEPIPPRAVRPGLPKELQGIIMRALARAPEERFQSAEAMRSALERHGGGGPATPPRGIPTVGAPPARSVEGTAPGSRQGTTLRSWLLIPLAVIVLAGGVIAGGLALGRLQLGGPLGIRKPQSSAPGSRGPGAAIRITDVADFDPFGDDSEHPEDTPLAADGDPSTAWFTDHYSTADFGHLKPGLGLFVAFGGTKLVGRVVVQSPLPGWTFQLLPGAGPTSEARPVASTSGHFDFTVGSSGTAVVDLNGIRTAGFTVWITRLAPDQGRFAAAVGEITVTGDSS